MRLRDLLCAALAMCLCVVAPAAAADTGSVSGVIFDQNGAFVADAVVRISGDQMPAGRTFKTDSNGMFRFPSLLPGKYSVEVDKPGLGKTSRAAVVEVDKDTQVDLVIGVTVKEELTVSAATPVVDMKSTEVNFNYTAEQIENLPLQRTYSGLFQLIPGVAENNSFAPSSGASRQDNKYLIDGVDITNPGFGYLSTEPNELDIVEFNVKKGAITAEFGRASGFVTNAVSKSGTNKVKGAVRAELRPRAFVAKTQAGIKSTTDRYVSGFSLGGPLVQNRAFWYASGQYVDQKTTDRVNNLGPVSDQKETQKEGFGKLTLQPNNTMFLHASYRYRPNECGLCGVGVNDSPSVATDTEGDSKVATAVWNWFPGGRTVVDVKYLHMEENSTIAAVTDLGLKPAFDVNNLAMMGLFSSGGVNLGATSVKNNTQDYKRDEIKAAVSQFLDFGRTAHQVKAGFSYEIGEENLTRTANGWGTVSIVQNNTQVQARYYPEQPSQVSPGRTYSLFVQDDITIGSRMVINAGLLLNRDEFSQKLATENTFLKFGFGDEVQPRIGVNYQLRKGAGDKVYANYGRYYAMDQKSSARSLAPARLFFNNALFNRTTGALISDLPLASTTGKGIDAGLKPTYSDEFVLGYGTPLGTLWSLDAFYTHKDASDFIEDIPTSLPATGPFHAAQLPTADRKFDAVTIELARHMADKWSLTTSYAWSRLEGNFDLDYSSGAVFNTSSAIQDGPGEFVEDQFRYGPLGQDRPHVFKAFASYMPVSRLTVGGYLRSQSGTPWAARGRDWDNGFRRYLEQAGTNRVEPWTNLDLLAAYRLPIGGRAGVRIEGRVINAFNTLTALSVDDRKFLDGRFQPAPALFAACNGDYACATDLFSSLQTTNLPNAVFGQPNSFAPARRFFLTFLVDF